LSRGTAKTGKGEAMLYENSENGNSRRRDLRSILKSRTCMVDDKKTDGALCVGLSVRMVMKRKEQDEERETNRQKQGSIPMPQPRRRCRGFRRVEAFPQG